MGRTCGITGTAAIAVFNIKFRMRKATRYKAKSNRILFTLFAASLAKHVFPNETFVTYGCPYKPRLFFLVSNDIGQRPITALPYTFTTKSAFTALKIYLGVITTAINEDTFRAIRNTFPTGRTR
jgi:hypothetical protein